MARPDRSDRLCLVIAALSFIELLQRPLEFAQYLSIRYTERLAEAGLEPSVGSLGDSYDNALMDSIIGLLKAEVIRQRGPWRNLEGVEMATSESVSWYNNTRLLGAIGHVPPAESEERYHRSQPTLAAVAGLR